MVELIFIHLPKTGGSSILQTLIDVYGEKHVRHFERDECLELKKNGMHISDVLSSDIKVIHGHFLFQEVIDIYQRDQSKLVTFMRSPVERVISNYNWWKHTLNIVDSQEATKRKEEPIEVYVKRPETRNKMARFLEGVHIDEFLFIGFLESFELDIQTLSKKLGWKNASVYHEKNMKSRKTNERIYDVRLHRTIKKLNKEDEKLYQTALRKFKGKPDDESGKNLLGSLLKFKL